MNNVQRNILAIAVPAIAAILAYSDTQVPGFTWAFALAAIAAIEYWLFRTSKERK